MGLQAEVIPGRHATLVEGMAAPLVHLRDVCKIYRTGRVEFPAPRGIVVALLVLHLPLRRACRLQAGEALRYE